MPLPLLLCSGRMSYCCCPHDGARGRRGRASPYCCCRPGLGEVNAAPGRPCRRRVVSRPPLLTRYCLSRPCIAALCCAAACGRLRSDPCVLVLSLPWRPRGRHCGCWGGRRASADHPLLFRECAAHAFHHVLVPRRPAAMRESAPLALLAAVDDVREAELRELLDVRLAQLLELLVCERRPAAPERLALLVARSLLALRLLLLLSTPWRWLLPRRAFPFAAGLGLGVDLRL